MLSTMLLVLHAIYYAGSVLNALYYYWCTVLLLLASYVSVSVYYGLVYWCVGLLHPAACYCVLML